MRDADEQSVQARMIALAEHLGWLTPAEKHAELVGMLESRLAHGGAGSADVELVCTLNSAHALDGVLASMTVQSSWLADAGRAGVLACLGSAAARERVLQAITSPSDADVEIAQVYLRHRPLADVDELRRVAKRHARACAHRSAGARARHARLAQARRSAKPRGTDAIVPVTKSLDVQRAIAGILIRADYHAFAKPELVRTLAAASPEVVDGPGSDRRADPPLAGRSRRGGVREEATLKIYYHPRRRPAVRSCCSRRRRA
jgi:hypothetical protein